MNIFVFITAALLSMPKQFITVYLGTLLESASNGALPLLLLTSYSFQSRYFLIS